MAVITLDAGSRRKAGAVIFEAWKYGIEVEQLNDFQIELTSANEEKLDLIVNKFSGLTILHKELLKEVSE
jgi:hypothetical protein